MSIKLVVFDIAGTTVKDPGYVNKAFRLALLHYGYKVKPPAINPLMGYEKTAAIRSMLIMNEPDTSKITDELIKEIHSKFVELMIDHYKFTDEIQELPNVLSTISKLKQLGIHVAFNTGFSREITDVIVERLNWKKKGIADFIICSDEVERGRPYSFMIEEIMDHFGLEDPFEVAKVGDTEVDIREGQYAGCKYVIAVTTGAFSRKELQKYSPTNIIDDIAEILNIID